MANPIEVNYQTGRQLYCFRSSLASLTPYFFNTALDAYQGYIPANWLNYSILIPEVSPGYYRVMPPTASLALPATEIIYEIRDVNIGPQISDAPAIANGNSQGVTIASVPGSTPQTILSNPTLILDICNLALMHIGQRVITSLTEETEPARRCSQLYASTRDAVLRDASWNFAAIIDTLILAPGITITGWAYVYAYPDTCVFVRKVYGDDSAVFDFPLYSNSPNNFIPSTNPRPMEFRELYSPSLNAKILATNVSPAYIEYTARVDDPTLYDQLFVKALAYRLASELSNILTGDADEAKQMMQYYLSAISEAQKVNGVEDGMKQRNQSPYVDVR